MTRIRLVLYLFLTIYGLALATLWAMRIQLIYPFDPTEIAPAASGEPRLKASTLTTDDNENLVLWSAPALNNKPIVVYFHGNAGNLAARQFRFTQFLNRGYGVLAMGYRGSSGSSGTPSEKAITNDAQALIDALPDILGQTLTNPIIYYGESLGTGVAVKLAKTHRPDALILEAPFSSLTKRASEQFPFFPIRLVLDQRWNSLEHITRVTVPLLVLHGDQDIVVPISHGKQLFNASRSAQKTFVTLNDETHHTVWSVKGQTAIYNFINKQ